MSADTHTPPSFQLALLPSFALVLAAVAANVRRCRWRSCGLFRREDPYGCGDELSTKRNHRDPFARGVPYHARCSALRPLLNHCGSSIFLGSLPWNEGGRGAGGGEEAEAAALGRRGGGGGGPGVEDTEAGAKKGSGSSGRGPDYTNDAG